MRRHIQGLREAAGRQEQQVPDGFFLVTVERAAYRAYRDKPFLALQLRVAEPREFCQCRLSARLYCTSKALWKLNWFLRDFAYDPDLLSHDQIDDKALAGLQGVVKISYTNLNGRSYLNLDGFAPTANWQDFQLEKAG
jgi:hypothetical protein